MIDFVLIIHVAAGSAALIAALGAIASRKGAIVHRQSGRIYTAAMMATALSAMSLAVLIRDGFLFGVGLFSFYLVFTGWRAAVRRNGRPTPLDRGIGVVMWSAGLAMVGWGAIGLLDGTRHPSIVLVVFGMIGIGLAMHDWQSWRAGPIMGRARIIRHLTRMMAGTIATLTATAVVNFPQLPALVLWLGPTALITPVIMIWTARIRQQGI